MSEWISVKDRLPKDKEFVLGYRDGLVTEMWWTGTFRSTADSRCYYSDVTHWMPLPSPPEPPPAPTLTVKEALREAISLLDTARQSTMGRRELPLEAWFGWSGDIALSLPRLRAALESEE